MMIAIINELKNINKWCDEDHEELITLRKEQDPMLQVLEKICGY